MAYTGIMATEAELDSKAGANVSSGSIVTSDATEITHTGTADPNPAVLKKTLFIFDKLINYSLADCRTVGSTAFVSQVTYRYVYTDLTEEDVDQEIDVTDYTRYLFTNPSQEKTVNRIEVWLTRGAVTGSVDEKNSEVLGFGGWNEVNKNLWVAMAESMVNNTTRWNWSDVYSTLDTDVRHIISDVVSSYVAIYAITFDLSTYSDRVEGETMINVHRETIARGLSMLRKQEVRIFIIKGE